MTAAERWAPVPGLEGAYEVSDRGRVRSLFRVVIRRNGARYTIAGRILTPKIHRGGWRSVALARAASYTTFYIHRLVAAVWGST
jgi:hypothetical protein